MRIFSAHSATSFYFPKRVSVYTFCVMLMSYIQMNFNFILSHFLGSYQHKGLKNRRKYSKRRFKALRSKVEVSAENEKKKSVELDFILIKLSSFLSLTLQFFYFHFLLHFKYIYFITNLFLCADSDFCESCAFDSLVLLSFFIDF